jgi:hypothetical protein
MEKLTVASTLLPLGLLFLSISKPVAAQDTIFLGFDQRFGDLV